MAEQMLKAWGRNIASTRRLRNQHGDLRRNAADPGLTQEGLGEMLEPPVKQATVSRWESGKMEPRAIYKAQLAAVLGVPADQLFPLPSTDVAA
jgi:transcriptional regulator with XRE-family HTH domain